MKRRRLALGRRNRTFTEDWEWKRDTCFHERKWAFVGNHHPSRRLPAAAIALLDSEELAVREMFMRGWA